MSVQDDVRKAAQRVTDAVDEALTTNDFSNLSSTIGDLVKNAAQSFIAPQGIAGTGKEKIPVPPQVAHPERYFVRPESAQGQKILGVIGGAIAVVFAVITLFNWLIASGLGFGAPMAVLTGIITALGIAMSIFGHRAAARTQRFKSYRKLILPKLYMDVKDLSAETGRTEKQVIEDLEGFTKSGMIKQGHFDDAKTCFIASDDLYKQYQETAARAKEAEAKRLAAEKKEAERLSPEIREILMKGNAYIDAIHKANDAIPGEEVTKKLDRMETIVRRIFDEVRNKPSNAKNLNMFMNYYLPTTKKLMDAYIEMDRQTVEGENIRQAKKEIENSLDTINDAFEKLLDSFFSTKAMDVSSDINVMKMMMKQEGLTDDDLTAMRKKKEAEMLAASEAALRKSTSSGVAQGGMMYQTMPDEDRQAES